MTTGEFENPGTPDGGVDVALQRALGGMMPPDDAATGVGRTASGGEDVLPAELAIGIGVFRGQRLGEIHPAVSVVEV